MPSLLQLRAPTRRLAFLAGGTFGIAGSLALASVWCLARSLDQSGWDVLCSLVGSGQISGWTHSENSQDDYLAPQSRQVGALALDFSLRDTTGQEVRLRDFVGRVPVVVEFACFT